MSNVFDKQKTNVYIFAFSLILIKALINASNIISIPPILDELLGITFMVCCVGIFLAERYTKIQLIAILCIGVCCLFTYVKAQYYYLITSFLAIITIKNVDLKKVLTCSYWIKGIYLIFHVSLYVAMTWLSPDMIQYAYRAEGTARVFFFVSHPNTFTMFLTWMMLEYIYVNYEKICKKTIILMMIISLVAKHYTDSNAGTIVLLLVCAYTLVDKYGLQLFKKSVRQIAKYGFGICSVFFVVITMFYQQFTGILLEMYNLINQFFTGRLIYGAYVFSEYGSSFFGRTLTFPDKVEFAGHWFDFISCDNTYIWFFVCYGTLYLILLSWLFYKTSERAATKDCLFIAAFCIYGCMEAYVINAAFCFPLLLIGKYIFKTCEEKNDVLDEIRGRENEQEKTNCLA